MRRARSTTSRCETLLSTLTSLALALAAACVTTPEIRPLDPRAALSAGADGAASVQLRSLPERPVLAAVVREGDPESVLGLTLYAPGDQAALAALGELLAADLERAGARPSLRVDRGSIVLDAAVSEQSAPALLGAVVERLSRPVAAGALKSVAAAVDARLQALHRDESEPEQALRACLGQAGTREPPALDVASAGAVARVEAARTAAFDRERVALSIVGPGGVVAAVERALDRGGPWPSAGLGSLPAPPPAAAGATLTSGVASGAARLHVAVRASDPMAVIAAAERLGRSPSALDARAERLGFRVTRAAGVADPGGGGCLALTLERGAAGATASKQLTDDAAAAFTLAAREARLELAEGPGALDVAARIARAYGPREAARLASFWALSRPAPARGAGLQAAWLELSLDSSDALRGEASARLERAASEVAEPAELLAKGKLEQGQAESWVIVANPCAASEEAAHRWGAASLASLAATPKAIAASYAHDVSARVEVEPFVSSAGAGFIAHAAPRPGEAPAALAERTARAAASAFFVEPASQDEQLAAEEIALSQVAARWAPRAPGLLSVGAALDHPTLLEPFGPPNRLARFESIELTRRLRTLSEGPIFVGLIARSDEPGERAAVQREVGRWLGSPEARACQPLAKPKAGRVVVTESRKGPVFLHVLVPLPPGGESLARARVVAELLGAEGGLLRSLGGPTLRTTARAVGSARWVGLLITVAGPGETVEASEPVVLALLARLARGELPDAELSRALEVARTRDLERRSDPRARVAALLDAEAPLSGVQVADVRAYLSKELAPEAAAIVLAKPD